MSTTAIIATALVSALWHPVHETVCEAEWNAETNRLEVALRLHVLDEQWISKQIPDANQKGWRGDFLAKHLYFDPAPKRDAPSRVVGKPIKFLGHKERGGHVWWFFEVICEDGKPPKSVQTRLLFDRHENYQHRIVLLGEPISKDGKRPGAVLTERNPKASLKFTARS